MEKYLDSCVQEIAKLQNSDGSFFSISVNKEQIRKRKFVTIFQTALIMDCLNDIQTKDTKLIKQKASKFLLSQKNSDWSFNYWAKNTDEYRKYRIPNDMDDTMMALSALTRFDPKIMKARDLAKITQLLTSYELTEGGPYQTWMITNPADAKWVDMDVAVNAQIGYYLSLMDIELPNLTKLFDMSIKNENLDSKYYPSNLATMYYLARFYHGQQQEKLVTMIEKQRENAQNIQTQAMTTTALMNLGNNQDAEEMMAKILRIEPKKMGAHPFCLDPSPNKKIYYMASSALTLAFVCEAIAKYRMMKSIIKKPQTDISNRFVEDMIGDWGELIKKIHNPEIQAIYSKMLAKMMERDLDREIIMINKEFALASKTNVSDKIIRKLANINLSGWMAYTIYDDQMDGDGRPEMLPIANLALINTIQLFEEIDQQFANKNIRSIYNNLLIVMEEANYHEITKFRFDPQDKLAKADLMKNHYSLNPLKIAEKSLPHIAGPLILAHIMNWKQPKISKLEQMLLHYLTARQLNDDAHDIIDDLGRGQVSYPGWLVLREYFKTHKLFDATSKTDQNRLLKVLWTKSITEITAKITANVQESRKYLDDVFTDSNFDWMRKKLDKLEAAAKLAQSESSDSIQFIAQF